MSTTTTDLDILDRVFPTELQYWGAEHLETTELYLAPRIVAATVEVSHYGDPADHLWLVTGEDENGNVWVNVVDPHPTFTLDSEEN